MNEEIKALISFLRAKGSIETRLRETSEGEIEYFQHNPPKIPGLELSAEQLIVLLKKLKQAGTLVRFETVTPFDSCEYFIKWCLSDTLDK